MLIIDYLNMNLGHGWQEVPDTRGGHIQWDHPDGRSVVFRIQNGGSYTLYNHEGVESQSAEPWLSTNAIQEALKQAIVEHASGEIVTNIVVPKALRDQLNELLEKRFKYVQALRIIDSYDDGNGCCPYGCDCPTIAERAL